MGLIQIGHQLFPIEGIDSNNMDDLAAIMPTLEFEYFIFPFLAHALGTLVGSTIAGLIAVSIYQRINLFNKVILAYLGGASLLIFVMTVIAAMII